MRAVYSPTNRDDWRPVSGSTVDLSTPSEPMPAVSAVVGPASPAPSNVDAARLLDLAAELTRSGGEIGAAVAKKVAAAAGETESDLVAAMLAVGGFRPDVAGTARAMLDPAGARDPRLVDPLAGMVEQFKRETRPQ